MTTPAPRPAAAAVRASPRSCASRPSGRARRGMGRGMRPATRHGSPRGGLAGARRSDLATACGPARDLDVRGAPPGRSFATRTAPTSSCGRCAAHEQDRHAWLAVDRPGRRRSRRRVARSAPRRDRAVVADADALLDALASEVGSAGDPSGVVRRWIDAERSAACRDRRALDGAGAHARARGALARDVPPRCPTARRSSSRRACRCARSSGAWRRARAAVLANRGANGIDGFVSTVLGVAQAALRRRPSRCAATCASCTTRTVCSARPTPATFVVIDNDGGGIFSYLPPAELPEFEQLFGTPHGLDLVEVARAHGATAERVATSAGARRRVAAADVRCSSYRSTGRRASSGTARSGRRSRPRSPNAARAAPARGASVRASTGSRPTRLSAAIRRRCRRRRGAGVPPSICAPRSATTNSPSPSRRPTRTVPRRGRAGVASSRGSSASAGPRGVPATAGVGCSAIARSTVDVRGRARRDRGREVREIGERTGRGPERARVVARGRRAPRRRQPRPGVRARPCRSG